MPQSPKTNKRGFNLIEAAIVLGIVGLVLGGIWIAASSVMERQRESRALSDLSIAIQNINNVYKGYGGNGMLSSLTGIFPADIVSGDHASGPWANSYYEVIMYPNYYFILAYIPPQSCLSFAPKMASVFRNNAYTEYNGSIVFNTYEDDDVSTPESAAYGCTNTDISSYNGMARLALALRR